MSTKTEAKEKVDYSKVALDPTKDVLITPQIFEELVRFSNMVKQEHTKVNFPQKTSLFHRKTHKKIDNTKKYSDEKLKSDYYRNIDLQSTEKGGNLVFDELSLSAIKLQAAFEDIFRYNVDKGNFVERPQAPQNQVIPDPQPTEEAPVVQGPTVVENES